MSSLPLSISAPSSGFMPDGRFANMLVGQLSIPVEPDPAEGAFAEGYARGFEEGTAQAAAKAALDAIARGRIEQSLGRLSEADQLRIETKLRETVLALCERTLAPLAADPEAIAARVGTALDLFRRSEDEKILRLHPDDIELLGGRLPEGLRVEADATLERGELRVETPEGGVEDGPGQWRRALSEALGL
jgi:flagellar assembly protein FliH